MVLFEIKRLRTAKLSNVFIALPQGPPLRKIIAQFVLHRFLGADGSPEFPEHHSNNVLSNVIQDLKITKKKDDGTHDMIYHDYDHEAVYSNAKNKLL